MCNFPSLFIWLLSYRRSLTNLTYPVDYSRNLCGLPFPTQTSSNQARTHNPLHTTTIEPITNPWAQIHHHFLNTYHFLEHNITTFFLLPPVRQLNKQGADLRSWVLLCFCCPCCYSLGSFVVPSLRSLSLLCCLIRGLIPWTLCALKLVNSILCLYLSDLVVVP
jgi:hypothetical protein